MTSLGFGTSTRGSSRRAETAHRRKSAPPGMIIRPALALGGDRIEGRGGPEIDHDHRLMPLPPVQAVSADAVEDAIGTDLCGILIENRHSGIDVAVHIQRRQAEITLRPW